MHKLIVSGGRPLEGEVTVSGSKNAALPILAAAIMLPGRSVIRNIPNLSDVTTIVRVLRALGLRAEYSQSSPNTVNVWNFQVRHVAPYELVTKMRASFFVIGPILAVKGLAKIPLPGGCAIGSRPVDIHIKGLTALGADVELEHGFVIAKTKKLRGGKVYLDFPSVGATETVMMAAALAEGDSIIENAAREPEILDLANFLNRAGAKIEGAGTEVIKVSGVNTLMPVDYKIIPDRIEAGTLLVAGAITGGKVLVKGAELGHMEATLVKLKECGAEIECGPDGILVTARRGINAVDIKTLPYPGFPTDMQPQFASLLSLANGTSVITETVFENRFMHVNELKRMGANIRLEGQSAIITGVPKLSGAPVRVSDLRAGAALILAGLAAEGETIIEDRDHHIRRGYDKITSKLTGLGAEIKDHQ
ncbi:UDP-N-acetylglucosamine 1-carboxyvinyltransferase [candidate division WOR-1 bacterium RIFOXYA12_FULL_52_29]|uniref:UDP-N-acetylglucosamine 1-carboxyvinyltransferase n=1 Tax=candidate division WOR-1 bacterium RIFOXYC12_FULL_54_18 TaxID=1802584 RepID=A0A1F4T3T0_UNCSA|nr:MAG: UDP-N-acetylglucosamine 1-carboxyvinyltransferase [candidate division WOR-1 bacterium RIFOXYA2_FULL_51_19]OGC17044.1 MAG: UDP-N-acetylglucosamine 1-carboxyvinyltransferase [candidate division WOR-1 bacterium RIFOXYA12_FULL_52_29]OGC25905.1 MAG: UDP-N-acetylglucosamine 1-carboxyvinyltransferase [candidate division WOR-1 bacterium RIFOXYB2_FULL_45_9]OGC27461.1 MAG: UDP-N-acetylglucosamine 1-carboxyvinyltransferase [candidate division WOR-1 bacterium RIFOXYC12_FULL_54_18]OGC29326.1 MAG: UD